MDIRVVCIAALFLSHLLSACTAPQGATRKDRTAVRLGYSELRDGSSRSDAALVTTTRDWSFESSSGVAGAFESSFGEHISVVGAARYTPIDWNEASAGQGTGHWSELAFGMRYYPTAASSGFRFEPFFGFDGIITPQIEMAGESTPGFGFALNLGVLAWLTEHLSVEAQLHEFITWTPFSDDSLYTGDASFLGVTEVRGRIFELSASWWFGGPADTPAAE